MKCQQTGNNMITFIEYLEEAAKDKAFAMTYMRANPPTVGHSKVIAAVAKHPGTHRIVVSHSQDSKKNPLTGEEKAGYLRAAHPEHKGNIIAADASHPTILHHLAKLHDEGHTHGKVVVGEDRVKEMHTLVHKYNGVKSSHGYFNFKKIDVESAGHRDPDAEGVEGMSATKMREAAKSGDTEKFKSGLHPNLHKHASEIMDKIKDRLSPKKINESETREHTHTVNDDLYDHNDNIVVKKGTKTFNNGSNLHVILGDDGKPTGAIHRISDEAVTPTEAHMSHIRQMLCYKAPRKSK